MKKNSFCLALALTTTLTLAACGRNNVANNPTVSSPAASPTVAASAPATTPSEAASPALSPQASAPADTSGAQSYRDSQGLFEISFPQGYSHQDTGSGVAFGSSDNGFGGAVDYGSAQGAKLTTQQLENALKQVYKDRLAEVTWQKTELQPDGSVGLAWVGRNKEGQNLDAVSYVEQRGDKIFVLTLFGINKPYNDYKSDADAIIGSYRVSQQ